MRPFIQALATPLMLATLAGCAQTPPPSAPITPTAANVGSPPGDDSIRVEVSAREVRISTYPEKAGTQVVDYFISRPDSADFLVHLESNEESSGFTIVLPPRKFYRGTYIIRAFGDKASEPYNEVSYVFDGVSMSDPGATSAPAPSEG